MAQLGTRPDAFKTVRYSEKLLERSGITVERLYCVGGGSKSSLWLQLKADITGKTVVSRNIPEYGCLGAAMLAGIGAGVYPDAHKAFDEVSAGAEVARYRPDPVRKEMYDGIYAKYTKMYDAFKAVRI